jgi:ribosomal protein S9
MPRPDRREKQEDLRDGGFLSRASRGGEKETGQKKARKRYSFPNANGYIYLRM